MISLPSSFTIHTSVTSLPLPPPGRRGPSSMRLAPGRWARRRLARQQVAAPIVRIVAGGFVDAGQEGQHLTDGAFPAGGFWQREMCLDVVTVAAAVLLLDHVAGLDQVRDDAESASFGNVQAGREVTQAHPRVMSDQQQNPGVGGQEGPARHVDKLSDSGKFLLVS